MFCSSCGKTIEKGSAFCKECGAPAPQVERMGGAAGPVPGLDASRGPSAASTEPPSAGSVSPPPVLSHAPPTPMPGYMPPPPPSPSGHPPGWQVPPPRRRTGLIVGIAVAAVVVLAGAGVGTYFGLRGGNSSQTALSSTTVSSGSSSTTSAGVSATVTNPSTSSSTSESTTTTLPSTTTTTLVAAPDSRLHSPAPGSPERKAILDVLRAPVEKELNQSVLFVIERIEVKDGFAFVLGRTVQPSGTPIDYSRTPYLEEVQAGVFSDEAIGLLQWRDGSWRLLTYNVGATDVAWLDWPQDYGAPQAIFPPLGN